MNTKAENLRAKRMLAHAIRYLGPDRDEKIAVGYLQVAIGQIYFDHRIRFSRATIAHRCSKCIQYRDAGASR